MSTLLTPRPPGVRDRRFAVAARQESLFRDEDDASGGETRAPTRETTPGRPEREAAAPTLDAAMTSLWQRLAADELATCPVCEAPMEPRRTAGAAVVGGRCRSCGSTLA